MVAHGACPPGPLPRRAVGIIELYRLSKAKAKLQMKKQAPLKITLAMMREQFYSAVVSDALDRMGLRKQSPRVRLAPMTGIMKLVGRCRTSLCADMAHEDPHPYKLE